LGINFARSEAEAAEADTDLRTKATRTFSVVFFGGISQTTMLVGGFNHLEKY
jgi:hypothetical protein